MVVDIVVVVMIVDNWTGVVRDVVVVMIVDNWTGIVRDVVVGNKIVVVKLDGNGIEGSRDIFGVEFEELNFVKMAVEEEDCME